MAQQRIFLPANPFANVSSTNKRYKDTFTATNTYTFTHSLGGYPQITVLNPQLQEVSVDVKHLSVNETQIDFPGTTFTDAIVIADLGGQVNVAEDKVFSTALPTPSETYSGQIYVIQNDGQPSEAFICLRGADGTYSWESLAIGGP